jgi:Major Facilitator Superfamily
VVLSAAPIAAFADEGGQGRRVGDHLKQVVGAEVGSDRVDREPERGGELVVEGGPPGIGNGGGHPDPVPRQLAGSHRAGGGELVGWPGEELEGIIQDPGDLDAGRKLLRGLGHGAERRVDHAGPDRGDGGVGVEKVGHDVKLDPRMRAVEVARQQSRRDPGVDYVDAQRVEIHAHRPYGYDAGLWLAGRMVVCSARPLFCNTLAVNGLIMATAPLIAVLMLGRLGFAPWQYGLAFAAPCAGGLIGSRLAARLVARFGRHPVLFTAGVLRACWSLWLAFIRPGAAGLLLVIAVQFGLVTCMGVFNPVLATYRLEHTEKDRIARTLSAWSVTSSASVAALTALWGLLASITSLRAAIAIAGLLLLGTPLLLPRHDRAPGGYEGGRADEVVPDGSRRLTTSTATSIAAATAKAAPTPR